MHNCDFDNKISAGTIVAQRVASSLAACMIILTLATLGVLSSHDSHADTTTSATASVTVASACTMSQDSSTFVPHTATIPAGTYKENIGLTTFNVVCNDPSGYSIYAVGYSNNEFGNTNLLYADRSITGVDIATGTATSGSSSAWAMKLSTVESSNSPAILSDTNGSFDNYHIVPNTYTKVASLTPITTTNQNSSFVATYAAYATGTQIAGTYNGKVKYTLVHPANGEIQYGPKDCPANKICYFPNAGSDVVDNMGDQDVETYPTFWAPNYIRPGYGFAGWSNAHDYIVNVGSATNPQADIFGPSQTITLNTVDYNTNGYPLYAIWVQSAGELQEWTGCGSLAIGEMTALTDNRDGNTYAVAKLADGNCWTTENLRFSNKKLDNSNTVLSSTNTNNPSLPLTNINYDVNPVKSNSLIESADGPWCTYLNSGCLDQSLYYSGNTTSPAQYMATPFNTSVYAYGNYYNWYSATAGNGKYSTADAVAAGDLCPIGWHLPYGGTGDGENGGNTSGGYYYLYYVVNGNEFTTDYITASNRFRNYPNNFIMSGYKLDTDPGGRGGTGTYWSATAMNNQKAYLLDIGKTFVKVGDIGYNKFHGYSVRCVTNN